MRALKGLVIGMGLLIVLGMGLLIYGLATRLGGGGGNADPDFGTLRATLPAGARIGTIAVQDGRIVVPVQLPGGGMEILVFGLEDGRRRGAIVLEPAP